MEYPLGERANAIVQSVSISLNPCCNGIYSLSAKKPIYRFTVDKS